MYDYFLLCWCCLPCYHTNTFHHFINLVIYLIYHRQAKEKKNDVTQNPQAAKSQYFGTDL